MPISSLFFLADTSKNLHGTFQILQFLTQSCVKKAADGAKCQKFFTILHEIVQKKLKLTITRENREEIHQNQEKYP